MPGNDSSNNVTQVTAEGKQAVTFSIVVLVATDDEALAVKRRVKDALNGTTVVRNSFSVNDMPSGIRPPTA